LLINSSFPVSGVRKDQDGDAFGLGQSQYDERLRSRHVNSIHQSNRVLLCLNVIGFLVTASLANDVMPLRLCLAVLAPSRIQ
jgi:hypothetical protein